MTDGHDAFLLVRDEVAIPSRAVTNLDASAVEVSCVASRVGSAPVAAQAAAGLGMSMLPTGVIDAGASSCREGDE
jgi:hypothetical protein